LLTINENHFLQKTTRLNQVGLPKEGGSGEINIAFGFSPLRRVKSKRPRLQRNKIG